MKAHRLLCVPTTLAFALLCAAQQPRPNAQMQRLAFMVGRFAGSSTVYPKDGKPRSDAPARLDAAWMLNGRNIRSVRQEQGKTVAEAISGWNPLDRSYHTWVFGTEQDVPMEVVGRMEGDRLIETPVPTSEAGIGVQLDSSHETGPFPVEIVFDGLPAAQAGIVAGDIVTEIEGQPTAGMTFRDWRARVIGREGATVHLKVRHGGQERAYALKRQSLNMLARITTVPREGGGYTWVTEVKEGSAYRKIAEGEFTPLR